MSVIKDYWYWLRVLSKPNTTLQIGSCIVREVDASDWILRLVLTYRVHVLLAVHSTVPRCQCAKVSTLKMLLRLFIYFYRITHVLCLDCLPSSQLIINTAIVYMHRFYMIHSFTKFHRNVSTTAELADAIIIGGDTSYENWPRFFFFIDHFPDHVVPGS